MIDLINSNSALINLLFTLTLISITGYYAYITKRILETSEKYSKLGLNPVIGIKINKISISEVFAEKRRALNISCEIANAGNAPAIEILLDSEIKLRYSKIEEESTIPMRFEPQMVSFLQPGQTEKIAHGLDYGNTFITHFFDDVRESSRLNLHRIETDATKDPFKTSRLYIIAYYRNSVGQYFKSFYEAEIDIHSKLGDDPIPRDNQKAEVSLVYIPTPRFHAGPTELTSIENELKIRHNKRELCGW